MNYSVPVKTFASKAKFMHLVDAFMQSHLHCILHKLALSPSLHLYCECYSWAEKEKAQNTDILRMALFIP